MGTTTTTSLSWNIGGEPAGSVWMMIVNNELERYMELSWSQGENNYRERVDIVALPSNLGRGEVLYFICPKTIERCRILYKAYGLPLFISREAYRKFYNRRVYYDAQLSGRKERPNTRYWDLDKKINRIKKKRKSYKYKGIPTKRYLRLERLKDRQDIVDRIRMDLLIERLGGIR